MNNNEYLKEVREQYESYPYPMRDPEDEKVRLLASSDSILDHVNHNCFSGKQSFNNFRILVAGGGTGTAAIYMAEQLRDRDAQIVYLDISKKSMEIAQSRAKIRGLNNIEWINGSILSLPEMGLDNFDFINCCGVLHHLEEPQKGLMALKSVLANNGAMGIMLYGKYGRTGVYQIQELMRLINGDEPNMQVKVDTTKKVIDLLPASNWFKRSETLFLDHKNHGDIGVYDLFLHSQDRAYTIGEVYDLIDSCDLKFISHGPWEGHKYKPETYIHESSVLSKIKKLDKKKQSAVAELLVGSISKHTVYITKSIKNTIASFDDLNNVPFFSYFNLDNLYESIKDNIGENIKIRRQDGAVVSFTLNNITGEILKYLDGKRSISEILDKVVSSTKETKITHETIMQNFKEIYELFLKIDWMLLRDKSLIPIKTVEELQKPVSEKYK